MSLNVAAQCFLFAQLQRSATTVLEHNQSLLVAVNVQCKQTRAALQTVRECACEVPPDVSKQANLKISNAM
jgi:hypothetical protein